jgi:serine/threonine protein kinase
MSKAEPRPTKRIGRYDLLKLIGEGGMGSVYQAIDTKVGRTVAVKVVTLPGEEKAAEKLRLRFMREVHAVSKVGHPNVVEVRDYGFAEDGAPYLVMELLRGRDLGAVLRSSKGPLDIHHVADLMLEVCAAVRACHRISIVHRDLKPGNIFLADIDAGPGWQVKVLDFGVAKDPFGENLTAHGQIVGTLRYLSPEQVNGTFGPESDQYAIGVMLYACLTKRLPYGSLKNVALLKAINKGEFPKPREHRPELPEALEDIILRAMQPVPTERFDSVYTLGQQLWAFASPLGRKNWELFYATPHGTPLEDATTEIRSSPSSTQDTAVSAAGTDEGATEIVHYDGTTVPGVDLVALSASVPTRVSASMSEANPPAQVDAAMPEAPDELPLQGTEDVTVGLQGKHTIERPAARRGWIGAKLAIPLVLIIAGLAALGLYLVHRGHRGGPQTAAAASPNPS